MKKSIRSAKTVKSVRAASSAKSSKANEQLFMLVVVILMVVGALAIFINASTVNTDNRSDASSGSLQLNAVPTMDPFATMNPTGEKEIWITAPEPSTTLVRNTSVQLKAEAMNDKLSYISFVIDGMTLCTARTMPYQCNWRVPKDFKTGDMALSAVMYSRTGEKMSSDTIGITVK